MPFIKNLLLYHRRLVFSVIHVFRSSSYSCSLTFCTVSLLLLLQVTFLEVSDSFFSFYLSLSVCLSVSVSSSLLHTHTHTHTHTPLLIALSPLLFLPSHSVVFQAVLGSLISSSYVQSWRQGAGFYSGGFSDYC